MVILTGMTTWSEKILKPKLNERNSTDMLTTKMTTTLRKSQGSSIRLSGSVRNLQGTQSLRILVSPNLTSGCSKMCPKNSQKSNVASCCTRGNSTWKKSKVR